MLNFFNKAKAVVNGSPNHPQIKGIFEFNKVKDGVLVTAKVTGLPTSNSHCKHHVFAVHIHKNGECYGTISDPFANAGTHYNPKNCNHPMHAGDLQPLFENNGSAYYSFVTNRFSIEDIVGRSVVIHDKADDFTSQPAGNSGNKIACGVIVKA